MGRRGSQLPPPKRRPVRRRKSEKQSVRNPDVNTDTQLKDSQGVRSPVSLQTLYVRLHEKSVTHTPGTGQHQGVSGPGGRGFPRLRQATL